MGSGLSWTVGDVIPVRHQWRGRVWFAHLAIVVDDAPERLILFEPAGAIRQWGNFDFATGVIEPPTPRARHTTDALILLDAEAAHAVSGQDDNTGLIPVADDEIGCPVAVHIRGGDRSRALPNRYR